MEDDYKIIEEVAKKCGIVLPKNSDYYYILHICHQCEERRVVFDWTKSEIFKEKEPPKPIPKTVQKRFT